MTADLNWPLPQHTELRERLVLAWSTDRGYHDLLHLREVLDRIDDLGAADNVEVVLAAWFHDAVYDDAGENEERSAVLAETELTASQTGAQERAGLESPHGRVDVAEVARLVRLTERHRPEPGDLNGELLCDADLAILAAPPARYADYVAGVRREYATVPEPDFRRGRAAVLRELAAKPHLFHTAYARTHWEPAARANLASEITSLKS